MSMPDFTDSYGPPPGQSADPTVTNGQVWEARRQRQRRVIGWYWKIAAVVAVVVATVVLIAGEPRYMIPAAVTTLMAAGLLFLPAWLVGTAALMGRQAGETAATLWRDRQR